MLYSLPIEKRLDFHCVPPDLLTYAELEAISRQLANEITSGQVRKYQWEQVSWAAWQASTTVLAANAPILDDVCRH